MKPIEQNLSARMNAVCSLAEHWDKYMPKKPGKRMESNQKREWDGLIKLLRRFSEFARDYSTILAKAPLSNRRFIAHSGMERLLENFNTLSRAAEQRRGRVTRNSTSYFLARAEDKLTSYCNRWLPGQQSHPKYVNLETPVAYFEKTYGISRSLYAPEIPLISIPLTDYDDPDRWFALAHEMGHHVYWNSICSLEEMTALHAELHKAVADAVKPYGTEISEPWGYWLEEIFAEICGILFAGPEYVISTQNIAAEKIHNMEDFASNDNEHPVPYLRPWITYEVLSRVQNESANDKQFLEAARERWILFSQAAKDVKCKCGKTRESTLESLQQEVGPVLDAILNRRAWPEDKCLLDLIQYIKQDPDPLKLEPLPPLSVFEEPPKPPSEEDIPESLKEIWTFLQKRIPATKMTSPEERSKNLWNTLVYLSIEDEHGHWVAGAHQDPQTHWWAFWVGRHVHNAVGSIIAWN